MEYITILLIVVDFILLGIAIYLVIDSFKTTKKVHDLLNELDKLYSQKLHEYFRGKWEEQ